MAIAGDCPAAWGAGWAPSPGEPQEQLLQELQLLLLLLLLLLAP